MRSKSKCGSPTLRQTVTVLHNMCIAHMNFSDKYNIIKSLYIYILYHQCSTIVDTRLVLFVLPTVCFLHDKCKGDIPQSRVTAISIEVKSGRIDTRKSFVV